MRSFLRYMLLVTVFAVISVFSADAQFKEEAFTQTYNDTTIQNTEMADSVDKMFSFKELFGGLSHKQEMRIGTMFVGSIFMPGSAQIYNKQYWKLPIVYGGIGAMAGLGGYYLHRYNVSVKNYNQAMSNIPEFVTDYNISPQIDTRSKQLGTWLLVGAGVMYWASLMDGVVNYKPNTYPQPGRATLYSILLPGLGQAYNGEYWKIPIYWGCIAGSLHYLTTYNTNYVRFKRIHNEATMDPNYSGPISAETAVWYRNVYRRYRDYSIVALAAFYLLQVIDANVFAYMHDFEVSDDISMSFEPAVIAPNNAYALNAPSSPGVNNSVGFRLGFTF